MSTAGVALAGEKASRLLVEFGSLRGVLTGSSRRLSHAARDSEVVALVVLYRRAVGHALRPRPARTSIADWRELMAYLSIEMGDEPVERMRLLHLDARRRLICEDDWSRGTVDEAPAYVREIVHRALDAGASGLLVVHNHPSGDPAPSRADVQFTCDLARAAEGLGIVLHDHVIIGRDGYLSTRAAGLIPGLRET